MGGGTLLESVNKLAASEKQLFSPDGTATEFYLVETAIDELISVEGTNIGYTTDLVNGKLTFASAPPKGVNTITITWRKGNGDRGKVAGMRFAELYNGASDSRVFLYGDGTNEAVYSGLDSQGQPSAEYFPDLNVIAVDSANTPITAMIRHYDRMLVFKTDSAHAVGYDTLTLADDSVTARFLCLSPEPGDRLRRAGASPAGKKQPQDALRLGLLRMGADSGFHPGRAECQTPERSGDGHAESLLAGKYHRL